MKLPNQVEKAFLLKKTFLFTDLNLDQLFTIANQIEVITINENETLFKNNQTALHIYIIAAGQIQLSNEDENVTITLNPGDLFGDEALFNDQIHQYQSKTLSKCQLLTLTKKHLTAIISECPSVAINLLEAFARQITFRHAKS